MQVDSLGADLVLKGGHSADTMAWLAASTLTREAAIDGAVVVLGELCPKIVARVGVDGFSARLSDARSIGPAVAHSIKSGQTVGGSAEILGRFQQFLVVPMVASDDSKTIGYIYLETSCPFSNLRAKQPLVTTLGEGLRTAFEQRSDGVSVEIELAEIADDHYEKGRFEEAELALTAALELSKTLQGQEAETLALEDLSRFHLALGHCEQADEFLNRALENFGSEPSEAAATLAETIHLFAKRAISRGEVEAAEARLLQAAEVLEILAPDHIGLVPILQDLSNLYRQQGLEKMAKAMLDRSLAIAA